MNVMKLISFLISMLTFYVVEPGAAAAPAAAPADGDPGAASAPAAAPADGDPPAPAPGSEEEKAAAAAAAAAAEGAPEQYEEFVVPDGMEVDAKMVEHFIPVLKGINLSQEKAQELVNAQAAYAKQKEEADQAAYKQQTDDWESAVKADKDLGGDHYDTTKRLSATAIDKLGTPALSEFLDTYGIGNHPEIVRLLVNAGKLVVEDDPLSMGHPPKGDETTRAQRLYKS